MRALWLVCAILLWGFWLASAPRFLRRAATGTLPVAVANGVSPAQAAVEGAASWGMSITTWSWINLATSGFAFMVFSLVGMLIWWRVRTGFGLLTAFVLLLGGSSFMADAIYGADLSAKALRAWEIGGIVWPLFFLWLYLFPNGRAVPRRLLWILGPLLGLFTVQFLLGTLSIFLAETSALAQTAAKVEPVGLLSIPILFFLAVDVYKRQTQGGIKGYLETKADVGQQHADSLADGVCVGIQPGAEHGLADDGHGQGGELFGDVERLAGVFSMLPLGQHIQCAACHDPVSYTHLDVYKRQIQQSALGLEVGQAIAGSFDKDQPDAGVFQHLVATRFQVAPRCAAE